MKRQELKLNLMQFKGKYSDQQVLLLLLRKLQIQDFKWNISLRMDICPL